ncbi:MAG: hypothetical protein ACLT8E_07855 [Akkermansia sp.]
MLVGGGEIFTQLTKDQMDKLNAFASTVDEKRNQPACVAFADKAALPEEQVRSVFPFTHGSLLPPGF